MNESKYGMNSRSSHNKSSSMMIRLVIVLNRYRLMVMVSSSKWMVRNRE